ncbi:MAG TPA: hypothetical protein VNT79_06050 [Phycisphaerae bacterium]|nr:hypothetical protein [Phycisphaerae bacterium]
MTLTISITPEVEEKLRERAVALGRDISQYAADLIRQGVSAPTFDEILAPVRQDFVDSGMTSNEIDEFGRDLIAKVRGESTGVSH